MSGQHIRVLLIEDSPVDAAVTGRRLQSGSPVTYALDTVASLGEAWPILDRNGADVILTDLNLPDSEGLDTLAVLRARNPHVPVVVLTGSTDRGMGLRAVQMGAQDFLEKGHFDGKLLHRALLYAIERHRLVETLRDMSLLDPLTGLYNRRGLFTISGKRVEIARRMGSRAFVLFGDLDRLKEVNDQHGHAAGDAYVQLGAESMKQAFRAADVLARVGGDEFVVLGLEAASLQRSLLVGRIESVLKRLAQEHQIPHEVSISCGVARFDPNEMPMERAIELADAAMYEVKRARKASRGAPE